VVGGTDQVVVVRVLLEELQHLGVVPVAGDVLLEEPVAGRGLVVEELPDVRPNDAGELLLVGLETLRGHLQQDAAHRRRGAGHAQVLRRRDLAATELVVADGQRVARILRHGVTEAGRVGPELRDVAEAVVAVVVVDALLGSGGGGGGGLLGADLQAGVAEAALALVVLGAGLRVRLLRRRRLGRRRVGGGDQGHRHEPVEQERTGTETERVALHGNHLLQG